MSRSRVGDMHTSLGSTGPTSSSGGGRFNEEHDHVRGEPGEADQSAELESSCNALRKYPQRASSNVVCESRRLAVYVILIDEELMIARDTLRCVLKDSPHS